MATDISGDAALVQPRSEIEQARLQEREACIKVLQDGIAKLTEFPDQIVGGRSLKAYSVNLLENAIQAIRSRGS